MPRHVASKLSAAQIKRLISPGTHFVGGAKGLALQVSESGTRSWVFRFFLHGKRREMGLGRYPEIPVTTARQYASRYSVLVGEGIDPIEHRRRLRELVTSHSSG